MKNNKIYIYITSTHPNVSQNLDKNLIYTEALEGHFYLLLITYYLLLIPYYLLLTTYHLLLTTYYLYHLSPLERRETPNIHSL